jgi:hypothetical protein
MRKILDSGHSKPKDLGLKLALDSGIPRIDLGIDSRLDQWGRVNNEPQMQKILHSVSRMHSKGPRYYLCHPQCYQVSLAQFLRRFLSSFVICDPKPQYRPRHYLKASLACMDNDRADFDNVAWDRNVEAWGKSQKLFRRVSTLRRIESFVTQKFGKTATWVTPMMIGSRSSAAEIGNFVAGVCLVPTSTRAGVCFWNL